LNGIIGGRTLEKSIIDVSGILEAARAESMARRTYVFVAFDNATNTDNNAELRIGVFESLNGLNQHDTSNIRPLSRLLKLPRVVLTDFNGLPSAVQSYIESKAPQIGSANNGSYLANQTGSPELKIANITFKNCPYVTFSPEGEILAHHSSNLTWQSQMSVGLAPARGTTVESSARDGAVVTAYGGSSRLQITRP
jgi:hypothetical protein